MGHELEIISIILIIGFTIILLLPIILSLFLDSAEDLVRTYNRMKKRKKKENTKKDREKNLDKIIFYEYYESTKHLQETFTQKKEDARELINIIFPAPQLSNNKFIDEIDDISKKFNKIYDNLLKFHVHYPKEDAKSEEIIRQERKKLLRLNRRLENILGELAILLLDNEDDVDIDEIDEDIKNDTDDIRKYSNNYTTIGTTDCSDIIDEIIETTPNESDCDDIVDSIAPITGLLVDAFGRKKPFVDCLDCIHSNRIDTNHIYCSKKPKITKNRLQGKCDDFEKRIRVRDVFK